MIAVYPGSFDPITLGHLDVIARATRLVDRLIIGVAINPEKRAMFTPEERVDLIQDVMGYECQNYGENRGSKSTSIEVHSFQGLTVDFALRCRAQIIIRGLRSFTDFESEFQLALTNRALAHQVETIFILSEPRFAFTSSRMVKEAFLMGADASRVDQFVPALVTKALRQKVRP